MRTRLSGGVAGEERRLSPLCRFRASHWPPKRLAGGVDPPCPMKTFPAGQSLLRAATLAVALAGCLFLLWAVRNVSSSRYITGTFLLAILMPLYTILIYQHFACFAMREICCLWNLLCSKDPKNHISIFLYLALGTVVCPPSRQNNASNRRLAAAARQAGVPSTGESRSAAPVPAMGGLS